MSEKRRPRKRQTIDLEQLKNDPNSFLSWDIDDSTLRKLETYRLYRVGYVATDIAKALGFAPSYLYELWDNLEVKGIESRRSNPR